jgi:hypothetical protein
MNQEKLKNILASPATWLLSNIVISLILGAGYIIYSAQQEAKSSAKIEQDIKRQKSQHLNTIKTLAYWQNLPTLPLLENRVKFAEEYFEAYDLEVTILDRIGKKNERQMVVTGQLKDFLLAAYDLNYKELLIIYGNIAIKDSEVAVDLKILGKDK